MPQLVIVQTDLTGGKTLSVRQREFSNGFATVEIDICNKYSHIPDMSFSLTQDDVRYLVEYLTHTHLHTNDMSKI